MAQRESTRLEVEAILFDLDGTLVDTAADLTLAVNRALHDCGVGPRDEAFIRCAIGDGAYRMVERALRDARGRHPEAGEAAAAFDRFLDHYAANVCDRSQPYPGVVDALRVLAAGGYALGCVTNKSERFAVPILEQLGLSGFLPVVTGGDTYAEKKPAPLPVAQTCRRLGVEPAKACLVGDSVVDVQAAHGAGSLAVFVTYGFGELVGAVSPDLILDRFEDLPGRVRRSQSMPSPAGARC